jgi:hypothetical protein
MGKSLYTPIGNVDEICDINSTLHRMLDPKAYDKLDMGFSYINISGH